MSSNNISCLNNCEFRISNSESSILQNHLEYFLESSAAIIYCKNKDGSYLTVNQPYLNTYGWRSDDIIIGHSDLDLFNENSASCYRKND